MNSSKLPFANGVNPQKDRPRFRMGLNFKLLLIVVCVLLVGLYISSYLVLNLQHQQLLKSSQVAASRTSNAIRASLDHAMRTSDMTMGNMIAASVVGEGGIERVQVINTRGVVRISSDSQVLGRQYDRSEAMCQGCHSSGDYATATHMIYDSKAGRQVLLTVIPVLNQANCVECHGADSQVLGLLITETFLGEFNDALAANQARIILATTITFILMAGLILLALRRFVIRPVNALANAMEEIGSGNLDQCVQVKANDELGDLAVAFDTMRQHLKQAQVETTQSNRELAVLYELCMGISASLELDQVLNAIAQAAREILGADIGIIGLVDSNQKSISVKAGAGIPPGAASQLHLLLDSPFTSPLALNQPLIVESWDATAPLADELANFLRAQGLVAVLAVPFWRKESLRGLVGIMSRRPRHFTNGEVRLLARLAQQTSVAVQNAQLYERVQYVTALEERERIAREIHDGLAHLVGSIRIWAEEAELSLEERNWKASRHAIQKVEETARSADAGLREEMTGLRETFVPGKELDSILAEYLSRFQREWGIETRLQVRRQDGDQNSFLLAPRAEIQLLRIIQESLTNVHLHARARHVVVDYVETPEALNISIQDDGAGFSPAHVSKGHFGLRIMNERATSVGGKLSISSDPGRGTRLEMSFPRDGNGHNDGSDL